MVDGSSLPVIAGLAIGIAFVAMFSLVFMPVTALTDEKIIENTKSLKEVQFFLEMHPDVEIRVDRDDAPSRIHVYYSVEKQIHEPRGFDSGIKSRELIVTKNSFGDANLLFVVAEGEAP